MVAKEIPSSIVSRLRGLDIQADDIKLAVSSDLDLYGNSENCWVIVTEKKLVCLPEEGLQEEIVLDFSEIENIRVNCTVGSAFLQAKVGGIFIDVARFTNLLRYRFERMTSLIKDIQQGKDVDCKILEEPHPLLCRTCARPLRSKESACPKCQNQSAVIVRLMHLISPYIHWIIGIFLVTAVSIGFSLIPPQLTRILVDDVLTTKRNVEWLVWIVLALVGTQLMIAMLNMVVGTLSTSVGTLITFDLRKRMFEKLQELSIDYYDKNSVGMLMTRFSADTEMLHGFVSQFGQGFLLNILLFVGIGAMLFTIESTLALYVLIPIPFVIFSTWFFWQRIYPRYYKLWDSQSKMSGFLNGVLSGIKLVRAFAQEGREIDGFERRSSKLKESNRGVNLSVAAFNPMMSFLFSIGGLIIWYAGGKTVLEGRLTIGQLMAFLGYIGMFYAPLSSLALLSNWISGFTTATHRIFEILDTEPTLKKAENPVRLEKVDGAIEFRDVTFGYEPFFPVLKNISFSIEPGEFIGIVGKSGSGKSTIINLICRFYDPDKGSVFLDGHDVSGIASHDIHRNIGIVLQEPFLFKGTIMDNIAYGRPDAGTVEILAAAKAAYAHDFIMKLPTGYDFRLGERGSGLSGGERQRIGIARALLCNPPVLILDEATSSVDTESELKIQEALGVLCKNRTTIAIAHRLSTLRGADRIYVVDQGRVVEFGTHDELMKIRGTYCKLVEIQTKLSSLEG